MPNASPLSGYKFLVIDDHPNIRVSLRMTLEAEGATISEADNVHAGKVALGQLSKEIPFDLVLLDIRMPDGNGLEILKQLSDAGYASRTIMISGEGTVNEAFQATQMGAFDFIEKPFTPERILVSVNRCLDFNNLKKQALKGQEIIGQHPAINEMKSIVTRVGPTNGRVLIVGETGTGKELVAKSIHRSSTRAKKPLIKVNCAAIPHSLIESELFGHEKGAFTGAIKARRGLFEQADGGSLFLDEIGELSLDVQAKLLRVLETGDLTRIGSEKTVKVDVRLIAATHRDLEEMSKTGEFREDLFYRLNVVTIKVPALRDRPEDIPLLAEHFLGEACEEHSIGKRSLSDQALSQLKGHPWNGNIRELRNFVERTAILSENPLIDVLEGLETRPQVQLKSVPATATDGREFSFSTGIQTWQDFHKEVDHAYIKHVLQHAGGNVSEAARILCLERAYLHRLMKKLGVQRDVVIE